MDSGVITVGSSGGGGGGSCLPCGVRGGVLSGGGAGPPCAAMRRRTSFRDLWNEPPVVTVPTLMIWGEEDSALCVETTDKMDPLMTDFTLRRLPGVSHWVQQEAPETVNAMIAAWLGGIAVPQAGDLQKLEAPAAPVTSSAAQ